MLDLVCDLNDLTRILPQSPTDHDLLPLSLQGH